MPLSSVTTSNIGRPNVRKLVFAKLSDINNSTWLSFVKYFSNIFYKIIKIVDFSTFFGMLQK